MGYVRGLVTHTLVKKQLGVQFRQGALPTDQTLDSVFVTPCWQPHECFSEVLWGLPEEPGLIRHSSSHAASPCHGDAASHRGGWDVVKQKQMLNFLGAAFVSSPQCIERQVGLEHWGIQLFLSLSLWLLTIPVLKSCQHTALCLPFAFCCSVHLELIAMLLELLRLASILQKKEIHPNTNKASFIRKLWCFCHFASPLNFSNPT